MKKTELLQGIKQAYFYALNVQQANNSLKDAENKSKLLNDQIVQTQNRINDLNELYKTTNVSYSPNLEKPTNVDVSQGRYVAGGIGILLIIFNLKGALHFNGWATFILIILSALGIWGWYNFDKKKRYEEEYNKINAPHIARIADLNEAIRSNTQNMSTEINKLNDSIPKLQTIKNNVDHNLVTSAKKEVENVKRKKPADLIKLPARRQLNPGYILSLYEVIDTNQVSTLGEAIKVVEDRFERAELNQQLKMQIAESQKELQKTIGQGLNEVNNNLADLGTTVKKSTREIGRGLKQTNNQLMRVNDNINELSNNVIGSAQNIEAAIIASNNTDKEISDTLRVIEQNNVEYARKSQQMIAVSQNGHKQII